jgi:hypothetical protein
MPPAGYILPQDRRVVTVSLPVLERGLEVSYATVQELNSLKWDIGAVTHHMDGELKRQSVGEYQARERYLTKQLASSQATVQKLEEEKKVWESDMAESLVNMDALAGALSDSREELSKANTQGQNQGPSPPSIGNPPGFGQTSPEYGLLVMKYQMLEKTLDMVTSNESSLKTQVVELKEEKAELKADVRAEKALHIASVKEWRAREERWNTRRSSSSSSASGSGPATGSVQAADTS